ncbi:hypothetical protein O181_044058 [Austropuccinia psidii MF-1]|uniref:Uncharacterized protein n=1 Tax=Austropuccinia psidii MF-1 TaxID=1389203 RepID=A0A9Q3DPD1_9BASI|nr:hypothetical protein [Austropuccinia psidii MF-1]
MVSFYQVVLGLSIVSKCHAMEERNWTPHGGYHYSGSNYGDNSWGVGNAYSEFPPHQNSLPIQNYGYNQQGETLNMQEASSFSPQVINRPFYGSGSREPHDRVRDAYYKWNPPRMVKLEDIFTTPVQNFYKPYDPASASGKIPFEDDQALGRYPEERREILRDLNPVAWNERNEEFEKDCNVIRKFLAKIDEVETDSKKKQSWGTYNYFKELLVTCAASKKHDGRHLVWILKAPRTAFNKLELEQRLAHRLQMILDCHQGYMRQLNDRFGQHFEREETGFDEWLFNAFFSPPHGLPVIGFTSRGVDGPSEATVVATREKGMASRLVYHDGEKLFGNVQLKLIKVMTQDEDILMNIGALLSEWHRTYAPEKIKESFSPAECYKILKALRLYLD